MSYFPVTFILPTYNEEKRIARCLKSIYRQDYANELVEIIIADGGSTDKTAEIAKRYKAKVFYNKSKLAEPGVYLATQKAAGELCVVMAADNVLPHKNWLKLMVKPFIDNADIIAAFTKIIPAKDDILFSRYFALLHADPFNEFVYQKASNPNYFQDIYTIDEEKNGYVLYKYNMENFPLIAIAQGFTFRKSWQRNRTEQHDDILPIINLLKEKKKIAYVPEAGIYHYSFLGFTDFLKKYNKRIKNALKHGYVKRIKYLSFNRKARQYLFIPYSLSFIFPLLVALYRIVRERKIAYIYHPFACFSLSFMILWRKTRMA